MAILGLLLSVPQPSGAWISIIKAFEAVTNNYVLAIIFLTVVIRLIWSVVDFVGKYSQRKMSAIQEKMQPEVEKLKVKYANQPDILNQKQNELAKKYMNRSYYTGCFMTFVVMTLNLVIFFTLFSGLNLMASYKMTVNYDNLKYNYANCLNVANKYFGGVYNKEDPTNPKYQKFVNYENLGFVVSEDGKTIQLVEYQVDGEQNKIKDESGNFVIKEVLETADYKTDFSEKKTDEVAGKKADKEPTTPGEPTIPEEPKPLTSNQYIINIIENIFPVYAEGEVEGSKEIVIKQSPALDENGQPIVDENGEAKINKLYLSQAVQNVAMELIYDEYEQTKDNFLWIENIWIADSPTEKSILSYGHLKGSLNQTFGKKNVEENEEQIYNSFMNDLKIEKNRANGYYILPILCILVSFLSMFITTFMSNRKFKKEHPGEIPPKKGKWMQIIMPILLGVFALFYNSVFAIYMLTGQIVASILSPIEILILNKIESKKKQKEEEKFTVDYSRKF